MQVPWKTQEDLFCVYVSALTQDYQEHNAKTLNEATLVCRQKTLAVSVSEGIPKLGQSRMRRDKFTPWFGRSFSGRPRGFRRDGDHFQMQVAFMESKCGMEQPVIPSGGVRTTSAQRQGCTQWRTRITQPRPPPVQPVTGSHEKSTYGRGGQGRGPVN